MATMIRRGRAPNDILAVLDVGTSKVSCLVAARGLEGPQASIQPAGADGGPAIPARVLGFGHQRARGMKAGVVVDLAEAERAIRDTIGQAERMAGLQVEKAVLSVACGRLGSINFRAHARLGDHPVNEADIGRVMAAGQSYAERDGRRLVHLNRINWRLDGQANVREPRGMRGGLIEADLHAVTSDEAPLRNLLIAIERAHVRVTGIVAAPFAAGLAVTSPEERRFGVTVLDIGAGVTTLSFFAEGHLVNTDAVAAGGSQITYDIAQALTIPLAEAERIKTMYGSLATAPSDVHEFVFHPQANDEAGAHRLTRAGLRQIIWPRAEDMFRLLRDRIERNKFVAFAGQRIVLTGGASQLAGSAEAAASVFGRPVRIGRPRAASGSPAGIDTPPFAVVAGLLQSLFVPGACALSSGAGAGGPGGYLGQVGNWLRASF
jgi:cell division protein FtsA